MRAGDCLRPAKRQIAASFSRAAASYDGVAALQRRVGQALLARLPQGLVVSRWLDLGCGTGHFSRQLALRFPEARGLALDLAEGMLCHARPLGGARDFVAGDAEQLPLAGGCMELVFSSLVLQWCDDFARVLAEARRVLAPGGVLAFSSLADGTLQELRASWQRVDQQVHVNRFRRLADYQQLCQASGMQLLLLENQAEVLHFRDLRQLTDELQNLGAVNLNPGRPAGLGGRARLQGLTAAYERWRQPEGLPATYQVVYGLLQRAGEP